MNLLNSLQHRTVLHCTTIHLGIASHCTALVAAPLYHVYLYCFREVVEYKTTSLFSHACGYNNYMYTLHMLKPL